MLVNHIDIIALQKEKIPAFIVQLDRLPFVNVMCVDHDVTLARLTEDFRQHYRGNTPALHQVFEHLSRTDRRKLVPVTDHHEPCPRRNCL